MSTPVVSKHVFSGFSASGNDSQFDVIQAIRDEFDALRISAVAPIVASVTNDFGNLVDAAGASLDVTVAGAELGDFVVASLGVDAVDLTVSAMVKAADVVTVRVQNESGSAADLASTTVRVLCLKKATAHLLGLVDVTAGLDLASLADGAGTTSFVTVVGAALGDFALVSTSVDVQGMSITATVTAADTVKLRVQNETGGAVDLASMSVYALCIPKAVTFAGFIVGTKVDNDLASLADGAGATVVVPTPGALVGDFVIPSISVDTTGLSVSGYVASTGSVEIRVQNESTAPVDLASATYRVLVIPKTITSRVALPTFIMNAAL